ncbi:MAG: class I SAM-dependent methyltransferase [Candidatus Parvarchaeota archaeon]|nr:class I SAM-dependent methyltransferase [Candidatus Jingweiarchaeum tengchongense]
MDDYYDKIARGYDELYFEEQMDKLEKIEKFVKFDKEDVVLDIGCGTGKITKIIKDKVKMIIGIDISREMARLTKKNLVPCIVADAENLPFKRNKFDKIICLTVIQNIEDQKMAINEMERVCKKGGMIILTMMKRSKRVHFLRYLMDKGTLFIGDIGKDFLFILKF